MTTHVLAIPGSRLRFREIDESDARQVVAWRNTESARRYFYSTDVVTPDTHRAFIRNRQPHDLVWMAEITDPRGISVAIGMTGLKVDVRHHIGEYGRTFVDENYRGQGYAKELEYFLLWAAFEWLRLDYLWLDAYTDNDPVIKLHEATGWKSQGIDIPGHTDERRPVLHMIYRREWWPEHRADFIERFKVELGQWAE